jgi:hypothetical protein
MKRRAEKTDRQRRISALHTHTHAFWCVASPDHEQLPGYRKVEVASAAANSAMKTSPRCSNTSPTRSVVSRKPGRRSPRTSRRAARRPRCTADPRAADLPRNEPRFARAPAATQGRADQGQAAEAGGQAVTHARGGSVAANVFHHACGLGLREGDGERPHSLVNVRCRRRNKIAR